MKTSTICMGARVILLAAIGLSLGCESTEPSLINVNPRMAEFHIRRVAILPFEGVPVEREVEVLVGWNKRNVLSNGEVVSDLLTTEMMRLTAFDYVERSQIRKILEEKNLSLTDLVRDKAASEIGKLLGVDAVILGKVNVLYAGTNRTVSFMGVGEWCRVSFSVRMVDTGTGTVLWSATVNRHVPTCDVVKVAREECVKIVNELSGKIEGGRRATAQ